MTRTHIGDDGDEGVGDGEGEAFRGSRLEALLHQGEAVFPTEQADVAQQVQRNLHVLGAGGDRQNNIRSISAPKFTNSRHETSFKIQFEGAIVVHPGQDLRSDWQGFCEGPVEGAGCDLTGTEATFHF